MINPKNVRDPCTSPPAIRHISARVVRERPEDARKGAADAAGATCVVSWRCGGGLLDALPLASGHHALHRAISSADGSQAILHVNASAVTDGLNYKAD